MNIGIRRVGIALPAGSSRGGAARLVVDPLVAVAVGVVVGVGTAVARGARTLRTRVFATCGGLSTAQLLEEIVEQVAHPSGV